MEALPLKDLKASASAYADRSDRKALATSIPWATGLLIAHSSSD